MSLFRLRRSEWIVVVYFSYTTVLALVLALRPGIARIAISINLMVIATVWLLAFAGRRGSVLIDHVRDWFPLPLMPLAYRQMGWFAPASHTYHLEQQWVIWDRWLLGDMGLRTAIESLGPVLPTILEASYLLVYTVPAVCMGVVAARRRERMDSFLTIFLLGIYLAYGQFPFWPSEPPRRVFPGDMAPQVETWFRHWNWLFLGGYGITTSVFPSAHVSSAFVGAWGLRTAVPEAKGWFRALLLYAIFVAIATVYGRYHYAVDAAAGVAVALVAWVGGRLLTERGSSAGRLVH